MTTSSSVGTYAFSSPVYAGAYHLGDGPTISFSLAQKPSAWHRFWMRVCLGWVWKDDAPAIHGLGAKFGGWDATA